MASQTIFPLRFGLQDCTYGPSSMSDYARDLGRRFDVRTGSNYNVLTDAQGGIGGFDVNGYVNAYPTGQTSLRYFLPRFLNRLGNYIFKYPSSMTSSIEGGAPFGLEFAVDANTRGRQITIPSHDIPSGWGLKLSGVPTGMTATTMALRPSMTFNRDAKPNQLVNDETVTALTAAKAKIFRIMDARGINGTIGLKELGNIQTYRLMSLPMTIDLCNQAGMDIWANFYTNQTDYSIRAEMDLIAKTLKGNLYIEYSNENWNAGFAQWEETAALGMEHGFHNVTYSSQAKPLGPLMRRAGHFTANPPTPLVGIAKDTRVVGNRYGSGVMVWQALQNIASGDANASLPATSNAYWQVLFDARATGLARLRYCSWRTVQIYNIGKAAYGAIQRDPSTILPVFAWQMVPFAGATAPSVAFDFDDNYKIFRRYATGPYWGGGVANYNMMNYNANHFSGWDATNKAKYLTDIPGCVNDVFAIAPKVIDATIAYQATIKDRLATYYVSKGLSPDYCQLCAYEANNHLDFTVGSGWTDDTKRKAFRIALFNDPRMGDMFEYYIKNYAAKIGGDICWYGRMGYGPDYTWRTQDNDLDMTSPQFAKMTATVP